tara:strand:- start:95 stop:1372 length:1278 start_codon:yes stop_codon:yes gene_type:complete
MFVLESTNLTLEQRLAKNVMRLMKDATELSGILIIGDRTIDDVDPMMTACTDGRNEWYGRGYCDPLGDGQLRFVLIHENYHKMFKHLTTWAHLWEIDSGLANMAMDYHINYLIWHLYSDKSKYGDLIDWIDGALYNPKYDDTWDTARIFWDLYEEKKKGNPIPKPVNPKTGMPSDINDNNNGNGQGVPQGFRDKHDFEKAKDMSVEEAKENAKEIDEAIRQGDIVAGKVGTGGARHLKELLKPPIDFREQIREFVTTYCSGKDFGTYNKPNRRYLQYDMIMPSTVSETVESLVCANDMSGSIGEKELKVVVGATAKAAMDVTPEELHVIYWDTKVSGHERYERDELDKVEDTTEPKGGGGTDVRCVPPFLREHHVNPTASIIVTDGEMWNGFGDWDHPVLWVIVNNPSCVPPVGKHVHVTSGDLR